MNEQSSAIANDSHAPRSLSERGSRTWWAWLGFAAIAIVLIPAALYSPGSDSALFFISGQKILHNGAAHYRDIVDVKPPLIYHMYAAAAALFGSTTSSFRLMDYLLQLATALMIGRLVARYASRTEALLAALIYACMYVAQSYNGTALTESYVGLFAVPMIAIQLRRPRAFGMMAIGMLAGGLFLLKFSLAASLGVACVAELALFANASFGRRIRNVGMMLAGFAIVAAMLPLYLAVFDAWQGFAEVNDFLAGYLRNQTPGIVSAAREALTEVPAYFADEFSLSMVALCAFGVAISISMSDTKSDKKSDEGDEDDAVGGNGAPVDPGAWRRGHVVLLRLATLNAAVMIAGVVIEAKYRAFHFSRLLPFAAIVAAAGAVWLFGFLRARRPLGSYAWMALLGLVPVALALSPLARYARHSTAAVFWTLKGPSGFDSMYPSEELGYSYSEFAAIADTVREHGSISDEMFVSSGVAGLVYAFAHKVPTARINHAAFLIAPYAPDTWRLETARYLVSQQPRFIVAHLNDSMKEMTGSRLSSADMLRTLPGVDSLLRSAYDTAYASYHFELYERRRR